MSQISEKAFETHVEEILLGQSGWKSGGGRDARVRSLTIATATKPPALRIFTE